MPLYLLDTNLLLYAHDQNEPLKQVRALEVLERLGDGLTAALSAQNLAEFANVALRRLTPPLSPAEVNEQLDLLEQTFIVYPLTAAVIREAVRGVQTHNLSYYDAQVWAAAKLNHIPVVLSEDFNVGATVEGVLFLNPLEPNFDLSEL